MNFLPLDVAVKASVLLAGAAAIQAALHRRGSASARHLVWTIAVAGLLALPIASAALPHWQVRIPVARAATPIVAAAPAPATAIGAAQAAPVATHAPAVPSVPVSAPFPWLVLAAIAYFGGVLVLFVRLALQPLALRRLARASRAVTDAAWRLEAERAARVLGVERPVRLLQHAADVMPMTFGVRRPTVVVPASAGAWSGDRRRAVLLHELAHVARHDCLTQILTAIACAAYWPHPGVWWAARRLRVERELACDDRVLAAGTEARDYAGHLLEIAHALGATPAPAVALGMARARQLEKRLLAVLDTARSRAAIEGRGRIVATTVAIAAVLPMAALRAAVVPYDVPDRPGAAPAPVSTAPQSETASPAPQDAIGAWSIRLAPDGASVELGMRTIHGSNGRTLPLARLDGLTASQISAAGSTVQFTSRREAGTFSFQGVCRAGRCGGVYTFEPNAAFAAELKKRGVGTPTADEQIALAMQDVGLAFLDELSNDGYTRPDVHGLVRAAQHGVDLAYVRGMAGQGYRVGTVDALVRLRDHGVDPEYVRGMAASGYTKLSADDLVRARDHGVDPAYVAGMREQGYGGVALADLIAARDHGVDPAFARSLESRGYKGLPLDTLRNARDHGVDPEYARAMQELGYRLTLDELIQTRDHGVDPAYVRGLAELGYKGVPSDALIRMRDHGVDPEYVRRLQQRGVKDLTVDQLIQRRDRGSDDPGAAPRTRVQSLRQQSLLVSVQAVWRSVVAMLGG